MMPSGLSGAKPRYCPYCRDVTDQFRTRGDRYECFECFKTVTMRDLGVELKRV